MHIYIYIYICIYVHKLPYTYVIHMHIQYILIWVRMYVQINVNTYIYIQKKNVYIMQISPPPTVHTLKFPPGGAPGGKVWGMGVSVPLIPKSSTACLKPTLIVRENV